MPRAEAPCLVADCGNPSHVRGYCNAHYLRLYRHGDPLGSSPRGTHGLSQTPEYRVWINMKTRCYDPNTPYFSNWGGRGVKVCDRWLASFENFLSDMGRRPSPNHSLDRWPDQNGNYEPSNCRWATQTEQMRNVTVNHIVIVDGQEMTLAEAAESSGLKYNTVLYRLKRGWRIDEALTAKPKKGVRPSCRA